ncbi:enoyl-CoA hydratase/isomerase family protein [Sphingomonas sp. SUN019]|uniref:enoyl-CoA hydratase/isomerase family protein n=1 Tax=Sphingomonas sp. SUN019 TaxID=2937788 RepID=UPI002164E181|nr:enoyl-CoA hydratase/isomerase family protein [Sphingomonas sp. SUN019]UVO49421.1 enoyl-CoA hydratase/isomerase family protein [Sphingomonas sp. SUN019]
MIALDHADGIATITLARPERRNALRVADWRHLAETIAAVSPETTVVLLRSGVEGVFCAGADIEELATLADQTKDRPAFRAAMRAAIDGLAALPIPVVAAIDSGCFGAGVALALAADLRVAGEGARFAVPPARLGIGYPAEDVARLAARVGQGQAARLLFTAATIDAGEALRIGLVDLLGKGVEVARSIAANDPAALRQLKATLADAADPAHAEVFDAAFDSPGFARGVATFRSRTRN